MIQNYIWWTKEQGLTSINYVWVGCHGKASFPNMRLYYMEKCYEQLFYAFTRPATVATRWQSVSRVQAMPAEGSL